MGHYIAATVDGAYDLCTADSAIDVSVEEYGNSYSSFIGVACCDSAGNIFRPVAGQAGTTTRCLYVDGFDETEKVCASYDMRMCTIDEIKWANDPSAGCEVSPYELEHVWTSTDCTFWTQAEVPQLNILDAAAAESPQLKVLHKDTRPLTTVFALDVSSYMMGVLTVLLAVNLWRMACFGASTGMNRQYAAVNNADSEECIEFEAVNVQGK